MNEEQKQAAVKPSELNDLLGMPRKMRDFAEGDRAASDGVIVPQQILRDAADCMERLSKELQTTKADFAALQRVLVGDTGASAILTAEILKGLRPNAQAQPTTCRSKAKAGRSAAAPC